MTRDGPWPYPTRAYFWPAVNKKLTRLIPGYFLTRPEDIFFNPKQKKLKNLTFLEEIFQIQTQTTNGWPDPTWVKNFDPNPSLAMTTWPRWLIISLIWANYMEQVILTVSCFNMFLNNLRFVELIGYVGYSTWKLGSGQGLMINRGPVR